MSFTNMTVLCHGRSVRDDFLFPDSVFESRLAKVDEIIEQKGLDGLLIYTEALARSNVFYLTGFFNTLAWSVSMIVLQKNKKPILLATIAPRDVEHTSKKLPGFVEIVAVGLSLVSNEHISDKAIEYMKEKGLLDNKKWGCVGFDRLPHMADAPWREACPEGLTDCTGEYKAMCAIKTGEETYVISQASSMAKRAVYEYMRQVKPGANEMVLASKIDREQRINGASWVSILTDAGKCFDTALHVPRGRDFVDGDTVSVFADVGLQFYHGSFGATLVIGAKTVEQEKLYAAASKLWDDKVSEIATTGKTVIGYQAAVDGEYQLYHIINGTGCDLVEYPDKHGSEAKLEPGMAITLSLSVKKDGVGSVFMSENFLVSENALVSLSGPGK